MPRLSSNISFALGRLRAIALNKRASPGTQLRAMDRFFVLAKLVTLDELHELAVLDSRNRLVRRNSPPVDDGDEEIPVDPRVEKMLEESKKIGGDDAKLSKG